MADISPPPATSEGRIADSLHNRQIALLSAAQVWAGAHVVGRCVTQDVINTAERFLEWLQ